MKHSDPHPLADVRGGLRLVFDGARAAIDMAESLHATTAHNTSPWPPAAQVPASQFTGLMYRALHGSTRLVGAGIEAWIEPFEGLLPAVTSPQRDALVAALNGVLGDHLLRSANPLAITMQLRRDGRRIDPDEPGWAASAALRGTTRSAIAAANDTPAHAVATGVAAVAATPSGQILLLVHDVCMTDLAWRREGHDHGAALAREFGYAPIYALYNSGLHVSENGRALAALLDTLMRHWPVPVQSLAVIGHGMGGLVARSACAQGAAAGQAWLAPLRKLVFIGTPHHGAPFEHAGNWLHRVMELGPYFAPFAELSRIRSEGIDDLRHGDLLAADWAGRRPGDHRDRRASVPLPAGVECYALASTAGSRRDHTTGALLGDGLVPVASALGRHRDARRTLAIPAANQWVGEGVHHLDLLNMPEVYRRLLRWLAP